jgi:hypothetical protein
MSVLLGFSNVRVVVSDEPVVEVVEMVTFRACFTLDEDSRVVATACFLLSVAEADVAS